ncbi:MAG: DinB family protein [Planctomycetota bacterium]
MQQNQFEMELAGSKTFFLNSIGSLTEADSGFRPTPESFSVSEQVAHVAQTIDWFVDGVEKPEGFNTDFAGMEAEVRGVTSLEDAKAWYLRAMDRAAAAARQHPESFWEAPIPDGPMFGGYPRGFIFSAIGDHTAHHRGALTVLARLSGHVPPMPYGMG